MRRPLRTGDLVVYRKQKHSSRPGPRAEDIYPAPHGEDYSYRVDKYWIVAGVQEDGKVLVQTRRGKRHTVAADDPALRRASWWQALLLRHRFPRLEGPVEPA